MSAVILKQSTAATLRVGPFMDATDGVTPETGVTLGAADQAEILKATGATVDISAATWAAITGAGGWYDLSLTTSHTDTLGMLTVIVQDTSVCMPVFVRAMVLPAVVYDSLVGGTDNLQVDTVQLSGTAQTARDIGASVLLSSGTGTGQVSLSSGLVRLSATGVDDIWDEGLSGHVAAGSAGAALYTIRSGTAQAGASTTITLDASASAVTDFYKDQFIYITGGTGAGQGRIISAYNGTTKVATVSTWATNPDNTSVFVIRPFGSVPGASAPTAAQVADAVWDEPFADHKAEGSFGQMQQGIQVGTAQAGTSTSITLDATGSSSTTDFYKYQVVRITNGTGAGQARQITAYNGTSKAATVDPAWTTAPSTDSDYIIAPLGIDAATLAQIADSVWDEQRSGHIAAGSFGEYVLADAVRVSGQVATADGLEAAVAGTTPLPSNVTQWNGAAVPAPTVDGVPRVDVTHLSGAAENVATQTTQAAILEDTGTTIPALISAVDAAIAALNDLSAAQVNAEVVDALSTDTYVEPSAVPAATASLAAKINFMTALLRNKVTQTNTTKTLRNDADSGNIGTAAVSDDGTTFTKGEWT